MYTYDPVERCVVHCRIVTVCSCCVLAVVGQFTQIKHRVIIFTHWRLQTWIHATPIMHKKNSYK